MTFYHMSNFQHEPQPLIFLARFLQKKRAPSPGFTTGQGLTTWHWSTGLGGAIVIITVIVIVGWAELGYRYRTVIVIVGWAGLSG